MQIVRVSQPSLFASAQAGPNRSRRGPVIGARPFTGSSANAAAAPVDAAIVAAALTAARVGFAAADGAGCAGLDAGDLRVAVAAEWLVGVPLPAAGNGISSSDSEARSLRRTAGSVPHRCDTTDTGDHSGQVVWRGHATVNPCRARTNAISPASRQSLANGAQHPGQELRRRWRPRRSEQYCGSGGQAARTRHTYSMR
jgi:hypothetical protein